MIGKNVHVIGLGEGIVTKIEDRFTFLNIDGELYKTPTSLIKKDAYIPDSDMRDTWAYGSNCIKVENNINPLIGLYVRSYFSNNDLIGKIVGCCDHEVYIRFFNGDVRSYRKGLLKFNSAICVSIEE